MKKILLLCFLIAVTQHVNGQYEYNVALDFDSTSSTGWQVVTFSGPGDTIYYNDSALLSIDTIHYLHNQWQIGRPQKTAFNAAYSYPNAVVTDTLLPCMFNDTSVFTYTIYGEPFDGNDFSFVYKLDIDSGDIARIDISTDNGTTWTNINDTASHIDFGAGNAAPDFSITTPSWDTVTIYNTFFALFRFTFITDSNTTPRDGWMLDNFSNWYNTEGVATITNNRGITIFPVPSKDQFTISTANEIYYHANVSILDMSGKLVSASRLSGSVTQISTSAFGGRHVSMHHISRRTQSGLSKTTGRKIIRHITRKSRIV